MPRPKFLGWSPMTITLSDDSKTFLKVRADLRGMNPGKIADEIIKDAQTRLSAPCGQGLPVLRYPAMSSDQKTSEIDEEAVFFAQHAENLYPKPDWDPRVTPDGRLRAFAPMLAKERRLASKDAALTGTTWKNLNARERSRIGAKLIHAAIRDLGRWGAIRCVPADQHESFILALHRYKERHPEHDLPAKSIPGEFFL